ncbi:SAM-dependent methyltransferase [Roseomonas terrae]|jgi:tRNA-Thr(GGU) m(6)t(6)A37 methyltransferase TsaA|uniref:SAM-dependent methyltransferase n=1 Tax=Neoroseomonas terrae TaxID=424799 RepID=A0ABS5ENZ3_9PROT|nr:SAM-dependent methyltransferase [Neoroseomonas terrae]MBR0652759.1 SAM-dependent methyltransferase [Neoroseomonas terrae]
MQTTTWSATRPGEIEGGKPDRADAAITFIGRIRTPFATPSDCPHRGKPDGPVCRIEVDEPWRPALHGIEAGSTMQVLYWMHLARRDLLVQAPKGRPAPLGTFALRSPNRPNPIASSEVVVVEVTAEGVLVRGLDCVDGTPLVDLKPVRGVTDVP